jgi:hypothetical protein
MIVNVTAPYMKVRDIRLLITPYMIRGLLFIMNIYGSIYNIDTEECSASP